MFDEGRHIEDTDLMLRTVLDEGYEEVPAGIWEGVAEGLDRVAARKKAAMIWWRRAAVSTAAAAAIAVGILVNTDPVSDHGLGYPSLIAEGSAVEINVIPLESPVPLTAMVSRPDAPESADVPAQTFVQKEGTHEKQTVIITEEPAEKEDAVKEKPVREVAARQDQKEAFPEKWEEEELPKASKTRTSIVLSGIAGSNSSPNKTSKTMMRLPGTGKPLNKTTITDKDQSVYGIPLSFGAGVKIDFSQRWAISAGVNYTMLSRKFNGAYTEVNDGVAAPTIYSDMNNVQHYIGIPVNVFYNIIDTKHMNFYAYAGGAAEKCISNKYEILDYSITHKEDVEGIQWSAGLGIGVEFTPWKHLGIYIDPSLRYYFDCNQPRSIRTAQPLMFGLEIGLRFML